MMWFDAHLDLAYLAVNGRNMLAPLHPPPPAGVGGPDLPAAVTLPSLTDGNVALALATIFTEPDGKGPEGYPAGDAERAWKVGRAQLEVYLTWRDQAHITLDLRSLMSRHAGTGEIRGGMGVSEVIPPPVRRLVSRVPTVPPLHLGILIENADPIRSPADLPWWRDRGVVAIGMAWARSSRYAGGNSAQDGISPLGRELVREMDRLGIVHDASHLSDRAFADLCEYTDRPIIASHSNCRAILGEPSAQRHLTDEQILAITRRGGVIGLNLFAKFIDRRCGSSLDPSAPRELDRPTIGAAIDHIEHVCQVSGSRRHIGLGSDMDGGFSAARLPEGIDAPRDLPRLAEALSRRGWTDDEVFDFACANWVRFWSHTGAVAAER